MSVKTVNKTFIFHREKYIAESLTKTLGYSEDSYSSFHKAEDLITRLKENPTLLLLNGDSPEDLKHILNKVFGRRLNETPLLIFAMSNQQSLIKRLSRNGNFPEFESCLKEGLLDVVRLPHDISEIDTRMKAVTKSYTDGKVIEKSQKIREDVSVRLAREQDVYQRHRMGNLTAAIRILNGAINSGDYDLLNPEVEEKLTNLYRKLIFESKEGWDEGQKEQRWKDTLDVIAEAKNRLEASNTNQKIEYRLWHREKGIQKILIIDDQIEMWKPLWEFILGANKVDFATSLTRIYNEKGASKKKNKYDLVILDVDFGEGNSNGIDILQEIKQRQFDLPVIMTTACDHAELTKLCLRMGAHSYFVKELEEDTRDSVDYYKKLRDMIRSVSLYNDTDREIWRKLVKVEGKIDTIDSEYKTNIGKFFKKAYYLLTLDEEHVLPRELLVPRYKQNNGDEIKSAKYGGSAYNSLLVADQIFIAKLLIDKKAQNREKAFECLNKIEQNGEYPNLLVKRKRVFGTAINVRMSECRKLMKASKARHVRFKPSEDLTTKNVAEGCIDELFAFLEKLNIENNSGTNSINSDTLQIDISGYLEKGQSLRIPHGVSSESAAECFFQGFSKCKSVKRYEIKHKILFIDDEFTKSAWHKPLQNYFFEKNCGLDILDAYNDGINCDNYSLILLDLVFNGDYEKGLEYLNAIRRDNLSIPVVMLTADNSAYFTRRCIFNGANNYFVKKPYDDVCKYFNEFEKIIDFYIAQRENTKRREWWSLLEKLDDYEWGIDTAGLELLKQKKGSQLPTDSYKELENQMISFPLREGYFYYLLEIDKDNIIDFWRIKRLIIDERSKINNVYICLGQFVEYIRKTLLILQDKKYLQSLKIPRNQDDLFGKLWDIRCDAKQGFVIEDNISVIIDELILVLKDFEFVYGTPEEIQNKISGIQRVHNYKVSRRTTTKINECGISTPPIKEGDEVCVTVTSYGHPRDNPERVYGVFVKISTGVNALLHWKEMSALQRGRIDVSALLKKGDKIKVKVEEVRKERGQFKIRLSAISKIP